MGCPPCWRPGHDLQLVVSTGMMRAARRRRRRYRHRRTHVSALTLCARRLTAPSKDRRRPLASLPTTICRACRLYATFQLLIIIVLGGLGSTTGALFGTVLVVGIAASGCASRPARSSSSVTIRRRIRLRDGRCSPAAADHHAVPPAKVCWAKRDLAGGQKETRRWRKIRSFYRRRT